MSDVTRIVEITQSDIDNGLPQRCSQCPGARAIMRTFPELFHVRVSSVIEARIHTAHDVFFAKAQLPNQLIYFVLKFDDPLTRKLTVPTSFPLTLRLP